MFTLYASNSDDSHRYVLGVLGKRPLFTFGVNPHLASKCRSDRTVSLVRSVASKNGYDGFVMFNIYPVRSKTVAELPRKPDLAAIRENETAIHRVLNEYPSPHLWAAWGNDVEQRPYLAQAVVSLARSLAKYEPRWLRFGDLTKSGNPRHPSRLAYEWKFATFNPLSAATNDA